MTDLSFAAQAVLKAACIHHGLFNEEIVQRRRMVAAVLRAAADQVVIKLAGLGQESAWYLEEIATELEAQ